MSSFGELEAAVTDRLWAADGAQPVRTVFEDLQHSRTLAYTTVMTVMERLFRKGMLTRVEHGRAYLYSPAQSRVAYTAGQMAEALAASTGKAAPGVPADCGLVLARAEGQASLYSLARPELLDLLAAAERLLEATGEQVALCPVFGQDTGR